MGAFCYNQTYSRLGSLLVACCNVSRFFCIYKLSVSLCLASNFVNRICETYFVIDMSVKDLIRAVVSVPKQSYNDENSLLDLSYITPRIVVAAGPSDDFFTNIYRSPIEKVVKHLNRGNRTGEKPHWHIWNLRGEGPGYNSAKVVNNWTYHPFPDHLPPTIELMLTIVEEIDLFLDKSPRNVALIHCKEGKGRSGTICCAYLMYEAKKKGIFVSVEETIATFTQRRMRRCFGAGVSIKSQIRYLEYWKRFIQSSVEMQQNFVLYNLSKLTPFDTSASQITKITIFKPTTFLMFSKIKLSSYSVKEQGLVTRELYSKSLKLPSYAGTSSYYELAIDIPMGRSGKDLRLSIERHISLVYCWFNLYFETLGPVNRMLPSYSGNRSIFGRKVIKWEDFDGFRGTQWKNVPKLFDRVDVQWMYHY